MRHLFEQRMPGGLEADQPARESGRASDDGVAEGKPPIRSRCQGNAKRASRARKRRSGALPESPDNIGMADPQMVLDEGNRHDRLKRNDE